MTTLRHIPPGGRGPLNPHSALRIAGLGLAAVVLMGILVTRLWFMQVINGQAYAQAADQNKVRTVELPAQRGDIVDRNGKLLAGVREGWDVVARPLELPEPRRHEVVNRLAPILGAKPGTIFNDLAKGEKNSPFEAVVLAADVDLATRTAVAERLRAFPGVTLEKSYVRTYPGGSRAAHILGYTGIIFAEDYARYRDKGYVGNEWVGQTGVEAVYESYLKGAKGRQEVEVNAAGQPVDRGVFRTEAPSPGDTLKLSIDLDTQKALEDQLRMRVDNSFSSDSAAGVALDPTTGQVLAMASYPTFNPEDYIRRRVARLKEYYRKGAQNMNNFAITGEYPPGSTFKPVTVASALEAGLVGPDDMIDSPPYLVLYKQKFANFQNESHGTISLPTSLEVSSDTVMYHLGDKFWKQYLDTENREPQQEWARRFGLGGRTGVDLLGERPGRIPTRAWKKEWFGPKGVYPAADRVEWKPGDNIQMSIGQGDVLATPLQMAVSTAVFANGGKLVTPSVAMQVVTPAGTLVRDLAAARPPRPLGLAPTTISRVQQGMRGAATGPEGTATAVFGPVALSNPGMVVAGKTGTAENPPREDHSWFVGYAPADKPKIVVAVVVANGGTGATQAAPAVCATMSAYLHFDPGDCGIPPDRMTN